MKNTNFTLQSSFEANYLNVQLQEPVSLDEIAINVVKEDCPEFLIPFRIVEINDSVSLRYKLVDTVALEYANMTLRKAEFVQMYKNLLIPFIKGNDWFLDYHNFCIDARYIFLNRSTNEAYFIYIPENSYRNTDEEISHFFHEAFIRATITDDANFQVRLFQYFSKGNVTLAELYRMIQEEDRKLGNAENLSAAKVLKAPEYREKPGKVQVPEKSGPAGQAQNGRMTAEGSENAIPTPDVPVDDSEKDEVMQALFGENKKKGKDKDKKKEKEKEKKTDKKADRKADKKAGGFGLFSRKKEQNGGEKAERTVQREQYLPQSGVNDLTIPRIQENSSQASYDREDRTEIISDGFQTTAYLELIDSPLPGALPVIELNFSAAYITIGRASSDEVQPDVAFNRGFTQISRRHARIEKRDENYFVIDLGSVNHTLLNGRTLVPNQPYQLEDDGELAFSDNKSIRYRIHL